MRTILGFVCSVLALLFFGAALRLQYRRNMMAIKTNGQVAYEAYCEAVNWKSPYTGDVLPDFEVQRPDVKKAWEAAAEAVRKRNA